MAIAYLMQNLEAPYVFPIVGGRKVEHLLQVANRDLEALGNEIIWRALFLLIHWQNFHVGAYWTQFPHEG